jgi:plasmid stabilization system protein ParE
VIYFRACGDAPDPIEIVRVLHGRMDPATHI